MSYDRKDPTEVMNALFRGEKSPIYEHTDGKKYRLRFSDNGKEIHLTDEIGYPASPNMRNRFFGEWPKVTILPKSHGGKNPIKRVHGGSAYYQPNNSRVREFGLYLQSTRSADAIISGDIVMDEVWDEMAKRKPNLLDKYKNRKELKYDFNKIRNGLKNSKKKMIR